MDDIFFDWVGEAGITFVSASTGVAVADTTYDIAKPADVQVGDVLLAFFTIFADTDTITTLAGWTQQEVSTNPGLARRVYAFRKVVDGTEPATFTWANTATGIQGVMVAYRGVNTTTPVDAEGTSADATADTTVASPGLTTTVAQALIVRLAVAVTAAVTTLSTPTGCTQRVHAESASWTIAVWDEQAGAAGAVAGVNSTADVATTDICQTFALTPA